MAHIGSRITCQGLSGGLGFTLQAIQGFRVMLGLHRDNGKENGNYYLGFRV